MSKILITGNGFDLAQGLPTRYADFIEAMNKLNSFNEEKISDNIKDYFDLNSISKNTKQIELLEKAKQLDSKSLESLKNRLDNKWFKYFKYQLDIETWIDFETALEKALDFFDENLKYIRNKYFTSDMDYEEPFPVFKESLLSNSYNRLFLNEFGLIKYKVEEEYFCFDSKFCKVDSKNMIVYDFDIQAFYTEINREWEEFVSLFNSYLIIFVEPLIEYIDNSNFIFLDYHFTFNYTNSYIRIFNDDLVTKHLHGKIDKTSSNNNLVMGFHTDLKKEKYIIPFIKGYQKMKNNTESEMFYDFQYNLNNADIYIWGHSLDISDKFYIDQIKGLLDNDNIRFVKLKVLFHSSEDELLKNLCNMYSISEIEKLRFDKKLFFIKATEENLQKEFKIVPRKR